MHLHTMAGLFSVFCIIAFLLTMKFLAIRDEREELRNKEIDLHKSVKDSIEEKRSKRKRGKHRTVYPK